MGRSTNDDLNRHVLALLQGLKARPYAHLSHMVVPSNHTHKEHSTHVEDSTGIPSPASSFTPALRSLFPALHSVPPEKRNHTVVAYATIVLCYPVSLCSCQCASLPSYWEHPSPFVARTCLSASKCSPATYLPPTQQKAIGNALRTQKKYRFCSEEISQPLCAISIRDFMRGLQADLSLSPCRAVWHNRNCVLDMTSVEKRLDLQ